MPVIELEDVVFSYPSGTRALQGASLSIEAGESVAIVGQNGAGKTTLVKTMNGLLRPTRGLVRVHEQDIRHTSAAHLARQIGFVFQNPRTQIFLGSVEAEITFGPKKIGMSQEQIEARLRVALELTGLSPHRHTHPYDLTPSDRKLLTIASIVSMDQDILILDEPSGGLDMAAMDVVLHIVEAYQQQGRTVITVTHDMDFVARGFARVVVMNQGRIVADGSTADVFSQHKLLTDTHLEPTAISLLAATCGLPQTLLTVQEMADYLVGRNPGGDKRLAT
jgi:energy-coupling factor transport system ATP-binding protein